MKVILTKDIQNIGHTNEVVMVADGYALNFLLPKKFAERATPVTTKAAMVRKEKADSDKALQEQLLAQNIETLAEKNITITMKANEKGHLYDAVGAPEILDAIREQTHVVLPKDTIRLEHPLKEIGVHDIPIAYGAQFGRFSITINAK